MKENKSLNRWQRTPPTLYKSQNDLDSVLGVVIEALKEAQEGRNLNIKSDEEGFCKISDVVSFLNTYDDFSYVNNSHIIELFFKDPKRRIMLNNGDRIRFKSIRYIKPPETLYFGTIENLRSRIIASGIRSRTKGYVKLYTTESQAASFASKFISNLEDKITTIVVDSGRAFSDGLKFSTHVDGEFIVALVDKKYLVNTEGDSYERH